MVSSNIYECIRSKVEQEDDYSCKVPWDYASQGLKKVASIKDE